MSLSVHKDFTQERYEAIPAGATEIDLRFHLALVLAHETGHRIGAIQQLEWSDIDLKREQIHRSRSKDKTHRGMA